MKRLGSGQSQEHAQHVMRQGLGAFDAAGQSLDDRCLGRADLDSLDGKIAEGASLTQQDVSFIHLGFREPKRPAIGIPHRALQQPGPTRAAVTALAAVRQVEAGVEGRIQHRLVRYDTETPIGLG